MELIQNLKSLLLTPEKLAFYLAKGLGILLTLIVIYAIYKVIVLSLDKGLKQRLTESRTVLVFSLVRSILRYAAFFIMLITVLQQLGINITAILASAGILGLAVSFGSQNLVRDVIAGIFIILENQFTIGDEVQISGIKAKVLRISLRMTVLKDEAGTTFTIPNGSISLVKNFSR
jgi:small conductance mechanosensitive channel